MIRFGPLASRILVTLAPPLLAALSGCAISTPVRMSAPGPGDGPDDRLQVSITHAMVDPARRAVFDRYVSLVAAQLPRQPGLVSHSIRRELFGHQVWTFTVWRNGEDRTQFFASGLHLQAMSEASAAIVHVRSVRVELPRSALPLDWRTALMVLGEPPWTPGSQRATQP